MNIAFNDIRIDDKSLARVLGFACNRAWAYVCFFCIALFNTSASPQPSFLNSLYIGSILTLCATLTISALCPKRTWALLHSSVGQFVGPCAAAVGSALILFVSQGAHPLLFLAASSVLTGFGSGLLLLSWGISFSELSLNRTVLESCIAFFLGVALYALISVTSPLFQYLFAVAMPLLSGWLFANSRHPHQESDFAKPILAKEGIAFAKFLAGITLLGFIAGLTRDIQPSTMQGELSDGYCTAIAIVTTFIIAVFLVIAKRSSTFEIEPLFRPALIAMLVGVLLLPVFGTSCLVPAAFVKSGYTCFELLVWIILSDLCHRFHFSPIQVFGFGRSVIAGAGVIGSLVAFTFLPGILEDQSQTVTLSAIIAIALTTLSNLLFSHCNILDLLKNPVDPQATFKDRCDEVFDLFELSPRQKEVACLLAYGRDANYISEKLFISKGTLNSHRLNIYRKMNIHSRQELLDLILGEDQEGHSPTKESPLA